MQAAAGNDRRPEGYLAESAKSRADERLADRRRSGCGDGRTGTLFRLRSRERGFPISFAWPKD